MFVQRDPCAAPWCLAKFLEPNEFPERLLNASGTVHVPPRSRIALSGGTLVGQKNSSRPVNKWRTRREGKYAPTLWPLCAEKLSPSIKITAQVPGLLCAARMGRKSFRWTLPLGRCEEVHFFGDFFPRKSSQNTPPFAMRILPEYPPQSSNVVFVPEASPKEPRQPVKSSFIERIGQCFPWGVSSELSNATLDLWRGDTYFGLGGTQKIENLKPRNFYAPNCTHST